MTFTSCAELRRMSLTATRNVSQPFRDEGATIPSARGTLQFWFDPFQALVFCATFIDENFAD